MAKKKENTPKVEKAPVMDEFETMETIFKKKESLKGTESSGLSPDKQVDLLTLANKITNETPGFSQNLPNTFKEPMNRLIAAGVVSMMVDESVKGNSTFSRVLQTSCLPMLQSVAKDMGVTFNTNLLEFNEKEETVKIDANAVNVSKETKDQVKKELDATKEIPELDGKKIYPSEENLVKALKYQIAERTKSPIKNLQSCVDILRAFRYEEAEHAENKDAAKKMLDERNIAMWFNDVTNFVTPTAMAAGIGKGMCKTAVKYGTPVAPFLILRNCLQGKEENAPEDDYVAALTAAIVLWVANNEIKSLEAKISTLDKKKNADEIKELKAEIDAQKSAINVVTCVDFETIKKLVPGDKMFEAIKRSYYGPQYEVEDYEFLAENIVVYGGMILNMFCEPLLKHSEYSKDVLKQITKYTKEQKEKNAVDALKQKVETKKEELKKEEASKKA